MVYEVNQNAGFLAIRQRPLLVLRLGMAFVLFIIAGCEDKKADQEQVASVSNNTASEKVLVSINGTGVTEYQLSREADRILGEATLDDVAPVSRKQLLDSLIARRAMALVADAQMTKEDLREIDEAIAAYGENLKMKWYLSSFSRPDAVTEEMVRKYYDDHPDQFGGGVERNYELLYAQEGVNPVEVSLLVSELGELTEHENWSQHIARINADKSLVTIQKGFLELELLQPALAAFLRSLQPQRSEMRIIGGRPHLGRLVTEVKVPPQPFNDVSPKIRRLLLSRQVSRALKKAAADVVGKSRIVVPEKVSNWP